MGISSDGMLVFGIPLPCEDETPDFLQKIQDEYKQDDVEFEDLIALDAGLDASFEDWERYYDSEKSGWKEGGEKIYDANRKKRNAAVNNCPVDLVMHCSYDYPMYILAVRGKSYSASRGYAEEISDKELNVTDSQKESLKAWCEKHNVEWQEPKWLLCSLYG